MKSKILFVSLLILSFVSASLAQSFDKTKLDQFFDRLAEKNKAMGSLVVRDGATLFVQPTEQSAVPLEATDEDKFKS